MCTFTLVYKIPAALHTHLLSLCVSNTCYNLQFPALGSGKAHWAHSEASDPGKQGVKTDLIRTQTKGQHTGTCSRGGGIWTVFYKRRGIRRWKKEAGRWSPACAGVMIGPGLTERPGGCYEHFLLCCLKHEETSQCPGEKEDFQVAQQVVSCLSHFRGVGVVSAL